MVHFTNRHSLKYEYNNKYKEESFEKENMDMNFYDELKKIMIALAQVEGDSEIISISVRAGKHIYRINAQCEVEEVD